MKLIYDDIWNTKLTCIAHITNCVDIRSHGLSKIIANCFPHSLMYEKRNPQLGEKNLAEPKCRLTPGTIEIFEGIPLQFACMLYLCMVTLANIQDQKIM